jgi:hypothetical protein
VKRLTIYEPVDFSEDSFTERGERVYKNMKLELHLFGRPPMVRVITCDTGIGITEEWIEDTITGAVKALEKDYPQDQFKVVRVKGNHILIEYAGTKGRVN